MPASRRRRAWFLRIAAGLLLFWIAFRDVDPAAVGRAFRLVDLRWLAAATISVFLTLGCVLARWRVLLGAAARARHVPVLLSAVIASQVANIVMPFRLGDAVRIGAVSRALALPPAEVLGSVAVERLFDALLVAVTALLLVTIGALPPFARAGMLSLAAGVALALIATIALVRFKPVFRRSAAGPPRSWPNRLRAWTSAQADLLIRGVRHVSRARIAATAFFWSCAVMAGSIFTAWLVLRAFALDAPAVSAAVVVIVVQTGSVVVPIPGAVGISQILTVQTLKIWDVPEAPALAYALLLYLVSRVPKLAVLPMALSILTRENPGLESRAAR